MVVSTYKSDSELLGALAHGETHAFECLVRSYTKEMLQQAFKRLRNQADAEDVVQDLFTDIWERRGQLHVKTSLGAYLHTSLKYQILRRIERVNLHEKAVEHLLHRMDDMQSGILDALAVKEASNPTATSTSRRMAMATSGSPCRKVRKHWLSLSSAIKPRRCP